MTRRAYAAVTGAYWGFTLTDGALRMLVLLHFHALGMEAVQLAFLFLLYEFCGILTNALGGWWAERSGLKATLVAGLTLQVLALAALSFVQPEWLVAFSIAYVMATQALSGVAKDLTKMSAKSAVKVLSPEGDQTGLMRWVAILTGSKNALKGVGFFLGSVLLALLGFKSALMAMAGGLAVVLLFVSIGTPGGLPGKGKKVSLRSVFSKSREINLLSAARVLLFGARDVWFVVALPLFLTSVFGWSFGQTGAFMALWVIGYGFVQAVTPKISGNEGPEHASRATLAWGAVLTFIAIVMAGLIQFGVAPVLTIVIGLGLYGIAFAINSSLHSYLILAFSPDDEVASSVGFYYMANACGRLIGTLLSGLSYTWGGLGLSLWVSAGMLVLATLITSRLWRLQRRMTAQSS